MADTENKLPDSSAIKSTGFSSFLSTLFGWRKNKSTAVGKKVDFVRVDLDANEQRVGQALLNKSPNLGTEMSQKVEELFNRWLSDNTDKLSELTLRKNRIDQIDFMVQNDPYVNRTVELYADESCQLDQQDTIISIETPDPRMTLDMYKLINQWGLTQNRIRETVKQLGKYGDAFWANTITERGVERIVPLQQLQVLDRIEFNPIKVMEMKRKREGFFGAFASNNYLLDQMMQMMEGKDSFSDLFDTKLFGFSIDRDISVPAWNITHFRVGAEGSQFYPWGTSPIIGALAPYKQTQSAIALQALSRELSFPVTLYEVKTDENMDEASQFATVNRVREAYDNIGVSQRIGNSEVYTANTKIWAPDGLLKVSVQKADTGSNDGVDDIKLYQERTAMALGIPRSFYGEEGWKSLASSGRSLTQQYKPFARKCFSIQSAFLEGLADLFRIHFAITGIYDFRIPFTLSMKYPVVEESDEYTNAKKSSIETANAVADLIRSAIGAEEGEPLPADIIRDIMDKYTFLDPSDIMKWTRDARYYAMSKDKAETEEEGDFPALESKNSTFEQRLREYELRPQNESQKLKEAKMKESYFSKNNELYFESLKSCGVNAFTRRSEHVEVFNVENPHIDTMLEVLSSQKGSQRLNESFSMKELQNKGKRKKK